MSGNICRYTLCVLLLHFFLSTVTLAQDKKVTLSLKEIPVMKLFGEIQKQTGYSFVINPRDAEKIGQVSIIAQDKKVPDILKSILEKKSFDYTFSNDIFVIISSRKITPPVNLDSALIVKGIIHDTKGNSLLGVTIRVKGTGFGVASDNNGKFQITLPCRDSTYTLIFSFIGMESQEVKIKNRHMLNIVMKEIKVTIDDVVVTGYGNVSRQSFTGNATTATRDEIKKIAPTNVLKALQVLDPSFRITTNNLMGSDPNTLPSIRIRGASGIGNTEEVTNSLSKTALQNDPNLPTFIVDGFEVTVSKIFDMDVNRIESITILKDAAATAIYGSRAANGVVVITTVAPKEGEILVSYNYDLNLQVPDLHDYNLMNAEEKIKAEEAAGLFEQRPWQQAYHEAKLRQLEKGVDTDWLCQPLQNSSNSKHYLRLEGGQKDLRYGVDVNYYGEKGVMIGSDRKRLGLNFDIQYRVKHLIFKNTAGYMGVNSHESPYGIFSTYTSMNPYYTFVDDNRELAKHIMTPNGTTIPNPLYEAHIGNYNKTKMKEFNDNFSFQYYITNKFSVKGSISLIYTTGRKNVYYSPESQRYSTTTYKGEVTLEDVTATTVEGSGFAYYNDMLGKHSINFMAGINMKEQKQENQGMYLRDLPAGGFSNPQFAQEIPTPPTIISQKTRLFGALLTLNYTYNNIYLADITGRIDGSSTFGTEEHYAPFWSIGAGINVHNYPFLKKHDWITELKIRGSYGITGKANFPANTARTVYSIKGNEVYATGVGGILSALGNDELKWEKTKITDIGGNLNAWHGLFIFKGTYYFRRTVDLIADMNVSSSSGFTSYKANIGEITNNGYELEARFRVFQKKNMLLYVNGNLASNHNKIQKISNSLKAYNKKVEEEYQKTVNYKQTIKRPLLKYEEGASTTSIYAIQSLGVDPQTGKELFRYKNGSIETEWIAAENVPIGNTEPKINGTLSVNYLYKGFTLDLYFTYTYGGQQYNETLQSKIENANIENNIDKRVFTDRWKEPGDISRYKSLKDWEISTNPTSRFIQDDNTLTLQSLTAGYELPKSLTRKFYFDKIKFSFTMNDVFRVSSIKQERGLSYPFARAYNFSISASF